MVRIFLLFVILITLTSSVSGKIFPGITSVTSALLVLTLVLSETNQPTKTVWKLFFWVKAFAMLFWVIIATLIDSNQRNLLFHKKFLSYFHFLSNTFICSQENRDNEKKKEKTTRHTEDDSSLLPLFPILRSTCPLTSTYFHTETGLYRDCHVCFVMQPHPLVAGWKVDLKGYTTNCPSLYSAKSNKRR